MASKGYGGRKEWSERIQQSIAMPKIYPHLWPDCEITEIDLLDDKLAKAIDVGGGDKFFRRSDGSGFFTGNRFRTHGYWEGGQYRDFTLRECELKRHLEAYRNNGFIPSWYVTGFVNETEDDFIALLVMDYNAWVRDCRAGLVRMGHVVPKNGNEPFYHVPFERFKDELLNYAEAKYYNGIWLLEPTVKNLRKGLQFKPKQLGLF